MRFVEFNYAGRVEVGIDGLRHLCLKPSDEAGEFLRRYTSEGSAFRVTEGEKYACFVVRARDRNAEAKAGVTYGAVVAGPTASAVLRVMDDLVTSNGFGSLYGAGNVESSHD